MRSQSPPSHLPSACDPKVAQNTPRWPVKKLLVFTTLFTFIALEWWVLVINKVVGEPATVHGNTTQQCIPQGKQGNIHICSAKLSDGSTQQFRSLRPLEVGAPVLFLRYDRRFMGTSYELQRY
jgi:hypothetical protein